jgi:hypothetical protein
MEPVYVCPRCGHRGAEAFSECPRCSIVVEKYLALRALGESAKLAQRRPPSEGAESERSEFSSGWATDMPGDGRLGGTVLRFGLLAVLVVWGVALVVPPVSSNAAGQSFIHLINLPFHEAGHIVFSPFGKFITTLGGTLGQLLVPMICGVALLWKSADPFGASICLWWFGENFVDIAPYINDARAGVLPLIGGNTGRTAPYGFHDWEYLLNETGLLRYDQQIATCTHALGLLLMVGAITWGAMILVRRFQNQRVQANA